jgi:hypothetical protein
MKTVYTEHGFDNRTEYLKELALEYDPAVVYALADLLGPEEDFDGLITSLEDYAEGFL